MIGMFGQHDDIALILPVFIIDKDEHPAQTRFVQYINNVG